MYLLIDVCRILVKICTGSRTAANQRSQSRISRVHGACTSCAAEIPVRLGWRCALGSSEHDGRIWRRQHLGETVDINWCCHRSSEESESKALSAHFLSRAICDGSRTLRSANTTTRCRKILWSRRMRKRCLQVCERTTKHMTMAFSTLG